MAESGADFLLHGGDLTRDGEFHEEEYALAREDLDTLPFPSFVIPGNMDVGNKHAAASGTKRPWNDVALNLKEERLDLFSAYFGPINWTFMHRAFDYGLSVCRRHRFCPRRRGCADVGRLASFPRTAPCRNHAFLALIETSDERTWDIRDVAQYDNWYSPSMTPIEGNS
jgi:hypothetical protein